MSRPDRAVTFTFEIGVPSAVLAQQKKDVEYVDTCLRGTAIQFQWGEAHDSLVMDGDPIGNQHGGGERVPGVTFVGDEDVIGSVTMGLSAYYYRSEEETGVSPPQYSYAAFTDLVLERQNNNNNNNNHHHPRRRRPVQVGATLVEPTWTFDRQRLGLNLWITSVVAPLHQPVSRYGFTLSSDHNDHLTFDRTEFQRFWDWLVQIKSQMISQEHTNKGENEKNPAITTTQQQQQQQQQEAVRIQMEPLYRFLLNSFSSSRRASPSPSPSQSSLEETTNHGYLYGTARHVSITADVFSISICRSPDGATLQSTLFVDGQQFDTHTTARHLWDMSTMTRNQVLALAISLALQDTDLLFQMGLIPPAAHTNQEVELLPLRHDGTALFRGADSCFQPTDMARRVVTLLAAVGLRNIMVETVLQDKDGWDIYDVGAAGATATVFKRGREATLVSLSTMVCGGIQMVVPMFVIYRSLTQTTEDLDWDVYLTRLAFGLYFIFFETTTWDNDNGDRVTGCLCFLPEFDTRRLLLGMLINKISMVVTDAAIIALVLRTFTVVDVTLNAMALFFLLEVDDTLVSYRDMEAIRRYQQKELFNIKAKAASWLNTEEVVVLEEDMPKIGDLPAWYFRIASRNVSTLAITILSGGCVWMIMEPFVFGWSAF